MNPAVRANCVCHDFRHSTAIANVRLNVTDAAADGPELVEAPRLRAIERRSAGQNQVGRIARSEMLRELQADSAHTARHDVRPAPLEHGRGRFRCCAVKQRYRALPVVVEGVLRASVLHFRPQPRNPLLHPCGALPVLVWAPLPAHDRYPRIGESPSE